jgi:hypothetical protein
MHKYARSIGVILIFVVSIFVWSTTLSAQTLGSDSRGITILGYGVSYSWSVNQGGPTVTLTSKISFLGVNDERTWDGTYGGCTDMSDRHVISPVPLVSVWIAACSSSIVCRGGQKVIRFQASVWGEAHEGITSQRTDVRFIDQEFFPSGGCSGILRTPFRMPNQLYWKRPIMRARVTNR